MKSKDELDTPPRHGRSSLPAACAAALLSAAGSAHADFLYTDFQATAGLSFVGAAAQTGNTVSLTPATTRVAGAMWYTQQRQRITDGFVTEFTFRISEMSGIGADGIAFVVQNAAPDAIGGTGGAIGYGSNVYFGEVGIPKSVAVEFDTWNNSPRDWDDLSDNHVSIQSDGAGANDPAQGWSMASANLLSDISDGLVHHARVVYSPGLMEVYVDGGLSPLVEASVNLASLLALEPEGTAWVGFTSATGGATDIERHEVLSWSFVSVPAPGAVALLALGGLAIVSRKRLVQEPR